MCLLTDPPGDIDIGIPTDTITTCSFVVRWSVAFNDLVCSGIGYIITITEGGKLISTDTTTLTQYNVTGLNDNTVYHVNLTASNNAGSGSVATEAMTTYSKQVHFSMRL